jgi:large subunit ribosomal protein L30
MPKIAITWKKSVIGRPQDQRGTIAGLGLRRLHQRVEHEDTPSIRGMVNKVQHLVEVEDVPSPKRKPRKSRTSPEQGTE